jgi:hypothetical protein
MADLGDALDQLTRLEENARRPTVVERRPQVWAAI